LETTWIYRIESLSLDIGPEESIVYEKNTCSKTTFQVENFHYKATIYPINNKMKCYEMLLLSFPTARFLQHDVPTSVLLFL